MSMIRCDLCNRSIDSDLDAECFVEGNPSGVFCKPCRNKAEKECASAHTPPPWSSDEYFLEANGVTIGQMGGQFIDRPTRAANAAHIVHCVNNFDALEAATADLLKLVRRAQNRLTEYLCPEGSNDADECMNDLLEMFDGPEQRRIEKAARSALAQSQGKDSTCS